jgi:FdhD protein
MTTVERATGAVEVLAVDGDRVVERVDVVAGEEPLQIRAAGPGQEPVDVAITMRTPGGEEELAAGFIVSEGLAEPGDVAGATFTYGDPTRLAQPHDEILVGLPVPFDRSAVAERHFVATASCGICGRATIDELASRVQPLPAGPVVRRQAIVRLPDVMRSAQAVFERTGGLHAAALFDTDGRLVALREDVGRHNALDKVVGSQVLAGALPLGSHVALVSGRVSFEIVQKAASAGIPIVCAVSAPTDLAVATAERLQMTLVGFLRGTSFNVYTGAERLDLGLDRRAEVTAAASRATT